MLRCTIWNVKATINRACTTMAHTFGTTPDLQKIAQPSARVARKTRIQGSHFMWHGVGVVAWVEEAEVYGPMPFNKLSFGLTMTP
mmetsp:Transcript_2687/g.4796  ORF Transcript_2687/g.4796 Transcript_2687/m.4796 type:complete len:85 (-) Transcript_2687:214-468(-)